MGHERGSSNCRARPHHANRAARARYEPGSKYVGLMNAVFGQNGRRVSGRPRRRLSGTENLYQKATVSTGLETPGEGAGGGRQNRPDRRRPAVSKAVELWRVSTRKGTNELMALRRPAVQSASDLFDK
jgi:hypothetical protein